MLGGISYQRKPLQPHEPQLYTDVPGDGRSTGFIASSDKVYI